MSKIIDVLQCDKVGVMEHDDLMKGDHPKPIKMSTGLHSKLSIAIEPVSDNETIDHGVADDDVKIVINVGGLRHETVVSTLQRYRNTRLCSLADRHLEVDKKEYFYDRHPGVFSGIIDFYRSGELHVPMDVCGALVKRELDFWQIDESNILPCCWTKYSSYIDNQMILAEFNDSLMNDDTLKETIRLQRENSTTRWTELQWKVWLVLDHPRSSRYAMFYAVTSFVFVMASISGYCLETLPILQIKDNITSVCEGKNQTIVLEKAIPSLQNMDMMCTVFFTIEIIVRIVFAPKKLEFFKSFMNIIDIVALLPLYVQVILTYAPAPDNCISHHKAVLELIFILRIIRIFRIFHLVKHYKALSILVHAIKASVQELLMLAIFLLIAMLVFSTLIFYIEGHLSESTANGSFETIPLGFWWAIITMTTVGYGDVHPRSAFGYVIGALCALSGLLLVALTIPVISNNFALFYRHARTKSNLSARKSRSMKLIRRKTLKKTLSGNPAPPSPAKSDLDSDGGVCFSLDTPAKSLNRRAKLIAESEANSSSEVLLMTPINKSKANNNTM
ncbi:unnamed protein product [Owenia fusiformis]|uniref:BTB domain-containing protein n=1 Tax=Owenia fusiformis TaxID=6347 RepID=A0A8S4N0P7_OWEFU|nr:unnamed protein product [Owenia fusiformis]